MSRIEFRKSAARRFPTPAIDLLEGRQLLNATSVIAPATHHAVQAEVTKVSVEATKLAKQEKAAATQLAHQEQAAAAKLAKREKAAAIKAKAEASKPVHAKSIQLKHKLTDVEGTNPDGSFTLAATPLAGAYNPTQLQTAYGVNQVLAGGTQGQGETIAIVDEFNDTTIAADLAAYSAYYHLPIPNSAGGPTFTVMNDTALGPVGSAAGTGVGYETALDVEMAHALAPMANILLVQVPASGSVANEFAQLLHGVQFAASQPGVVGVSLSYGYPEGSIGNANVVSLYNTYLATGAAANVAVTVSTGDGSTPLFPATTPSVVAVGGTSLYLASARGKYSFETAWGGLSGAGAGGGGPSNNFAAPTFQSANGVALSTKRTIPDISMVADPVTAVSIYDSLDGGTASPWTSTGGTSVAAPLTQGMLALVQEQRIAAGQPILTSVEFDTAMYEAYNSPAYATYFHDVTLGNNKDGGIAGYPATTGYDLATGIGSPIANTLVPYLTSYVIGT